MCLYAVPWSCCLSPPLYLFSHAHNTTRRRLFSVSKMLFMGDIRWKYFLCWFSPLHILPYTSAWGKWALSSCSVPISCALVSKVKIFVVDGVPTALFPSSSTCLQNDKSQRRSRHKNSVKLTVSYLNLSDGMLPTQLSSLHFETSLMTVIYPVSQAVHRLPVRRCEMAALFPSLLFFCSLCFRHLLPQMSAAYLLSSPYWARLCLWVAPTVRLVDTSVSRL